MDQDSILPESSIIKIVADQISTLLVIIGRPVVWRQILTLGVILAIAWLIPELVRRWLKRRQPVTDREKWPRWRRWLNILYFLFAPIISLALTGLAVLYFSQNGFPHGLLQNFLSLVIIWLVFRGLLLLVQMRFGEKARPYRQRIFSPLFVILVTYQVLHGFVGLDLFFDVPIIVFSSGEAITLGSLLIAFLAFYAFAVGSWIAEQVINRTLPDRFNAEPGMIQSVATLTRYAILGLGVVVSLSMLGFDATSLAIVAGGLSVGIGIGLQEIVANFVSGLTLLFEQSLRPGDVIELEGRINRVEKVSLRATIVRTLDNIELIIPNAIFTTAQVSSLTKSSKRVRVRLPFGVSYSSDPEQVRQVAISVAVQNNFVLADPQPSVLFRAFGDSSLDFELAIWTDEPHLREIIKSKLYYQLWTAFSENGIEIPFPQRDLNLRRGWEKIVAEPYEGDSFSAE